MYRLYETSIRLHPFTPAQTSQACHQVGVACLCGGFVPLSFLPAAMPLSLLVEWPAHRAQTEAWYSLSPSQILQVLPHPSGDAAKSSLVLDDWLIEVDLSAVKHSSPFINAHI
jgi:hypothetical protein